MEALRNSVQNVDQVKQSSNYVNEDQPEQHNYDNAVNEAKLQSTTMLNLF